MSCPQFENVSNLSNRRLYLTRRLIRGIRFAGAPAFMLTLVIGFLVFSRLVPQKIVPENGVLVYSQASYAMDLPHPVCPGEKVTYTISVAGQPVYPAVLFVSRGWWSVQNHTWSALDTPISIPWLHPFPGGTTPLTVTVPMIAPGQYEYTVTSQIVGARGTGYVLPMTVRNGCG